MVAEGLKTNLEAIPGKQKGRAGEKRPVIRNNE